MDQLSYIPFLFPGLKKVKCLFTTRHGGQSQANYAGANLSYEVGDQPEYVLQNRQAIQDKEQFTYWQELKQVHGTKALSEPSPAYASQYPEHEGDGLMTSRSDQALVIKVADCQPILLAHNSGSCIAALHIGWRGNRAGFIQKGVKEFCQNYQLRPSDIFAVRGPSLGPGHSEFINFQTEWGANFFSYYNLHSQTMDLWQLSKDQLLQAGLTAQNIFSLDLCTYSLPELFFSYRRDAVCGRQAGIIWIKR